MTQKILARPENGVVVVILISFLQCGRLHEAPREVELLKKKFSLQQLGKKKWLENRELEYSKSFPVEFMNDMKFVLSHIKKYGHGLAYASTCFKEDRDFVLKAVQYQGLELQFANVNMHKDQEIILASLNRNPYGFRFASNELLKNKEFVLNTVRKNGHALLYVDDVFLQDREIILAAVQQNGEALRYNQALELKDDREIIFEAIKQTKKAFQWISTSLLRNTHFMLQALKFVGAEIYIFDYSNKEIMLKAVQDLGFLLEFSSDELKKDRDIILTAVRKAIKLGCKNVLEYASQEVATDKEFVLKALKFNSLEVIESLNSNFKAEKEIILEAVKNDGRSLFYASKELQKDPELDMEALKCNGYVLEYQARIEHCYFGAYLGITER
ncbi:hypothetical protein C9374_001606 [Naegleria lovaniensis]|uniref:DUF4116 domain-containing protein n=1 Tax=Naegleria lovaniensis TaxID=51637 RepID=A0AA88GX27_NAELO|nr:uncharacterized protein C9374_001606 [Naegleria lovaniensis]KAG2387274.1 hypothetical protein C9374_001606 [Naegleria lovaniensis]